MSQQILAFEAGCDPVFACYILRRIDFVGAVTNDIGDDGLPADGPGHAVGGSLNALVVASSLSRRMLLMSAYFRRRPMSRYSSAGEVTTTNFMSVIPVL